MSVEAGGVTSPEQHLGRPLGTDFQLADWNEVGSWYRRLGEESPHVLTRRIGATTEGRDFLLTIISSAANLERLDEIRRYAAILADPRGYSEPMKREAVERGRVVLLISPQMHSTETGGTEAVMKLAYTLATSNDEPWVSARDNVVVGLFPCTNPDGLDHVVGWYREQVGTPFEASGMLRLYQHYTGHDNNRDWFMLTQAETRLVTEQLYRVWRPQVYWDLHQQASNRERLFVPPYRDPLNPNLDPAIISGITAGPGARWSTDFSTGTQSGLCPRGRTPDYSGWDGRMPTPSLRPCRSNRCPASDCIRPGPVTWMKVGHAGFSTPGGFPTAPCATSNSARANSGISWTCSFYRIWAEGSSTRAGVKAPSRMNMPGVWIPRERWRLRNSSAAAAR